MRRGFDGRFEKPGSDPWCHFEVALFGEESYISVTQSFESPRSSRERNSMKMLFFGRTTVSFRSVPRRWPLRSSRYVVIAAVWIVSLVTMQAEERKPLAVQKQGDVEVSLLSVEKKKVWRDQFGNESRAKEGQWAVFKLRVVSPTNTILLDPLELIDAGGVTILPVNKKAISWQPKVAPGDPAPDPAAPAILIPFDETVVFPIAMETELKLLQVGKLAFSLDGLPAPTPEPKNGSIIRGRVMRGPELLAEPIADTPVALVVLPESAMDPQPPGRRRKKKEEPKMLFLSIAQQMNTDDDGNYIFHGVAPGRYLLAVQTTTGMHNVTRDGKDVVIEIASENDVMAVDVLVGDDARRVHF